MVEQAPDYVAKKASRMRALTPVGIVEGLYHHAAGGRLSDALRNLSRDERYLTLTDLTIRPLGNADAELSEGAAFGLLNLEHVAVIVPLEE